MHCEIIDCHFNIFFVEIQLKKENLKSVFWGAEFGHPNRYTDLPNSLDTKLTCCVGNGIHKDPLGVSLKAISGTSLPQKRNLISTPPPPPLLYPKKSVIEIFLNISI